MKRERERVPIDLSRGGRVKQAFREESDINTIMARWRQTGILPSGQVREPMYGDFSNADDYLTSVQKVTAAQDSFKRMPAEIRSRFDHSPASMLAFLDDPANEEEAIKLGLMPDPNPPVVEPAAEPDPEPTPDV